jgi:hypothetical protein
MGQLTLRLNGKRWTHKRPRKIVVKGEECDGVCDYGTRTISVRRGVKGVDELDTYLHELRHATGDFLEEDFVKREAKEIAEALWILGYRMLSADQRKQLGIA